MNAPEEHEGQLATLFRDSTANLEPDVAELVAGGVALGRTAQRRRRTATAAGVVGVVAIVGATLATASAISDSKSTGGVAVYDEPSAPEQVQIAVPAADVPATVATMLPSGEVGPALDDEWYSVFDLPDVKVVFFRYDGTLTNLAIDPADTVRSCEEQATESEICRTVDGRDVLTGTASGGGVSSRLVSVWQHGYVVTVVSSNVADGTDGAPPVMAEPPMTVDQLLAIASSEVWFS